MKTILALFALAVTVVSLAAGQNNPSDRTSRIETELKKLVQAWDEAYVRGDTATLDRLLADEFSFVGGPKKADYLASFKSRPANSVQSAVSTDIQVQVYDDAAVLTGIDTITINNAGQTLVTKWLYMDVWIKRSGRWQCVKTYSSPATR
ncbi:MAG TPA: nuclear transport factor 2 family protein [Pyrinomonadaceae bacterium]|jgi:ketosteroid isomerase-like protein|nr:nuclear transport factor 2 family protein [Pyrinomonadaceae bacterium]